MDIYEWETQPAAELLAGISGKGIVGENLMLCRFSYEPNVVEPIHSHESEQFSCVIEGRVRFVCEGKEIECGPGEIVHFPPHQPHGMSVLQQGADLLEIFGPLRPDLILAMCKKNVKTQR